VRILGKGIMRSKWFAMVADFCPHGFCLFAVVSSLSLVANAQWTPVHARETKTITVSGPSGHSHTVGRQGTFDRNSSGFELEELSVVGGTSKDTHLKNAQGYFVLVNDTKRAYQMDAQPPSTSPPWIGRTAAIGEEMVEGRQCLIFPVYEEDGSGNRQLIGKTWKDPTIPLEVRQDITIPGGQGVATHIIMMRSEITTGQEPDKFLFKIPSDFEITQPPLPSK